MEKPHRYVVTMHSGGKILALYALRVRKNCHDFVFWRTVIIISLKIFLCCGKQPARQPASRSKAGEFFQINLSLLMNFENF